MCSWEGLLGVILPEQVVQRLLGRVMAVRLCLDTASPSGLIA